MSIPVVFTQKHLLKDIDQSYVGVAVRQARRFNPEVVLIGDEHSARFGGGTFYQIEDFFEEAAEFGPRYRHMNSNPHEFEKYCMQEYFVLKAYMRETGHDRILSCDSDVMIYRDVSEVELLARGDCLSALSTTEHQPMYRWAASGCNSFWTLEGIEKFCDVITEMYTTEAGLARLREKWDWHRATDTPGGVGDMTLLWFFSRRYPAGNTVQVLADGSTFDDNINVAEGVIPGEYEMDEEAGIKRVRWSNGVPYIYNFRLRKPVRFNSLHFQGNVAKGWMVNYLTEGAAE